MPIIKRNCLENIRSKVNIYDLVSPYVHLKKSGSNWKGLSPFTEEKTPSFYALAQKNIFKCFSSGYAGDIFKFIQLKENLNFNEAAETIAKRFSIPLEYENENISSENLSLRKELFIIHELARNYYYQCFNQSTKEAQLIQSYFYKTRSFSKNIAETFFIGYAPLNDCGLIQLLVKNNLSITAIKQSGLFYCKEHETNPNLLKPRFSGRLIIPINDIQSRPIAFTARKTDLTYEKDPSYSAKYINSPETPIFNKSNILFGLDHARKYINEHTHFILVEGQLDCMRCIQEGIHTAIAPQGTAITESQLNLIKRYTSKLKCLLDSDNAGQKAALRMLPLAIKTALDLEFLRLPEGEDPDSFFRKNGAKGYNLLQSNVLGPIQFAYQALIQNNPAASKTHIFENIYTFIKNSHSAVTQQAYLSTLAYLSHTDPDAILKDFEKCQDAQHRSIHSSIEVKPQDLKTSSPKVKTVESELLLIILHHQDLLGPISSILAPEWISINSLEGEILTYFIQEAQAGMSFDLSEDSALLNNQTHYNCIYTLLAQQPPFLNPVQAANTCIKTIFSNFIENQKKLIENQILRSSNDNTQLRQLLEKRLHLRKIQQTPPKLEFTFVSNAN